MRLGEYLANRLKEVFTEGKWVVGINFKEQIIDMDWEQATQKIGNYNTIADLTFHIDYYLAGVSQVLEGGTLKIRDKFSFDAPPIQSEQDWNALKFKFFADAAKFISLVEKMTNNQLLNDFTDKQYGTFVRNIDVMIEHAYYHLGQIILIKKRMHANH